MRARQHRRPQVDADSLCVLQDAIETLGLIRGLDCPLTDPGQPYDPADVLHLLWSLVLQADDYLAQIIAHAHAYGYSHDQIRVFLAPQPHAPSHPPALQRHQTQPASSQDHDRQHPVESMTQFMRDHCRQLKRWSSGQMALR